jgi:lipopolysaccharide biosynthesis glycosyltransferase
MSSKNLLCTIVTGDEAKDIAQYSVPAMEAYAARCGADFQVLGESEYTQRYKQAFYEKLQVGRLLEQYDRVLYVDADIIILPDAQNVFDVCPRSHLGVTVVGDRLGSIANEHNALKQIFGFEIAKDSYWNAGVILASREHRGLFDIAHDTVKKWTDALEQRAVKALHDQSLFNFICQRDGLKLHDLGSRYNRTRAFGAFHARFKADFIHYAGLAGHRTRLMRKDAGVAKSGAILGMLRTVPPVSWLRDKLIAITN